MKLLYAKYVLSILFTTKEKQVRGEFTIQFLK